jgi:coronin-1B/1C/6
MWILRPGNFFNRLMIRMLMPNYDADTGILYLAGKGDGNIRYYEWVDDETNLYYLSEYKSSDPQRGIGFLPKRAVNVSEVEVARAYKVHPTLVEPISFRVPRKADGFQSDLYPDCIAPEPTVTAKDFFLGKILKEPKRISLQGGFQAIHKDFSPAPSNRTSMLVDVKVPSNEKEVCLYFSIDFG